VAERSQEWRPRASNASLSCATSLFEWANCHAFLAHQSTTDLPINQIGGKPCLGDQYADEHIVERMRANRDAEAAHLIQEGEI
jgi:hypothetical protein